MDYLKIENGILLSCDKDVEGVLVIPDHVRTIDSCAFDSCTKLRVVVMPDSLKKIGECAFSECTSLESVVFGSNLGYIGDYAFSECTSLKHIYIPATVWRIGEWVFGKCDSLESIVVDSRNPVYDSREGCNAIIDTFYDTLVMGCKTSVIPSTVKRIGECAFEGCRTLSSIEIPSHVTKIGAGAFQETGLKTITIPSSVNYIGERVLDNCPDLESITVDPKNTVYDSREECNAIIETASGIAIATCRSTDLPDGIQVFKGLLEKLVEERG